MSYMDTAMQRFRAYVDRRLRDVAPFRATVASVDGTGMVTVKRLGTASAESELRARVLGFALDVDDEVLCLPVNGKPVVVGMVQRAAPTAYPVDGDLMLADHDWQTARLRLGDSYLWVDGTGALRIKSSAPASDTDGTVVGSQS